MASMATAMRPESRSAAEAITAPTHRPVNNSSLINRWLFVSLLTIPLLLLAACGPAAPSSSGSSPTAETVLKQARQAMDAVQSYRFAADITNAQDEEIWKMQLTGEWASPGDSRVRVSSSGSGDPIFQEFISVGGRNLARIPEYTGDGWVRTGPSTGFVPSGDLMFPELDNAKVEDGVVIDGTPMYYVTGIYEPDPLPPPAFQAPQHYGLFINQETMRLRRLIITSDFGVPGPLGDDEGQEPAEETRFSLHLVYDFFDYNEPVAIELPSIDPCTRTAVAKERLNCDRLAHRVYWLGERLETTGSLDLELDGAWINYGNEDDSITEDSRLTVVYASPKTGGGKNSIYLEQWTRLAWEEYVEQFSGYDAGTSPASGPVNWWQHPCVEEEVYYEANGAEVHLFKAHLLSLIYIYPMTQEEVSQCLKATFGAVGAHVYFEETVIEFSVQDSVSPAGAPATPYALAPGATPRVEATKTYPVLVLRSRNPYNNMETVRSIAASLTPYEKP